MRVRFTSKRLEGLYTSERGASHYQQAVVDSFFEVVAYIRAAKDERDLYAMKSLHYEKLLGREPQRSVRLNKQWRLIVVLVTDDEGTTVEIAAIEDYH
jgi:proteic killer suppression protein